METIINKTKNGSVIKISEPVVDYHIEFFSMVFVLSTHEFNKFKEAVHQLNDDYWGFDLDENSRRKIQVPLANRIVSLNITKSELRELKQLLIPGMMLYRRFRSEVLNGNSINAYFN